MKKILTAASMREVDAHTLQYHKLEAIQLMEQAALACTDWICQHYSTPKKVVVWCGKGNNGGDGLAVARLLHQRGYEVSTCVVELHEAVSSSCFLDNLARLPLPTLSIRSAEDIFWDADTLCVDAVLGSGVSRPVSGAFSRLLHDLSKSSTTIVSIDIPSGLPADGDFSEPYPSVTACHTLVLQLPKPVLFDPAYAKALGTIHYLSIGLSGQAMQEAIPFGWELERSDCSQLLQARARHAHKGIFGHLLVVAGGYGKMGAALLAAKASLRSGVGKVSCAVPRHGNPIIQAALPEAMTVPCYTKKEVDASFDPSVYDAITIGPGIGMGKGARNALWKCLKQSDTPVVVDADAIRLLAAGKLASGEVLARCVFTPHPGEADALFGQSRRYFERLSKAADFARTYKAIVVVKGGYTAIINTQGTPYFCTLGNPGMSTAGSGDVLAGIIGSLLAQGFEPFEAAKNAVLWHATSGDIAAATKGEPSMIAGDIVETLGDAWKALHVSSTMNHR